MRGLLLLLIALTGAFGFTCEPFLGLPSQCASIDGLDVALPDGVTQAQAFNQSGVAPFLPLLSSASASCASAAFAFFCSAIFPPCQNSSLVAAPRRLCRSVCVDLFTTCAAELATFGGVIANSLPNCSANDSAGEPQFPIGDYTIDINGTFIPDTCYVPSNVVSNGTCNKGLTRNEQDVCFFKCPNVLVSPRQMRGLKISGSITSVFSGIGWLVAISSAVYRYRMQVFRWPRSIIFFLGISCLFINLAFYIGMVASFEPVWCVNGLVATQSHPSCAAQGIFFILGFYGAASWVMFLSLNLLLVFLLPKAIPPLLLEIIAHVIAIVGPLISIIYALARDEIRYPSDFVSCAGVGKSLNSYVYPVIGLIAITVIDLLVVLGYVAFRALSFGLSDAREVGFLAKMKAVGRHAGKRLKSDWRLLTLAVYTCVCVGMPSLVFLYQLQRTDVILPRVQEQYMCLLDGTRECHPRQIFSYSVYVASYVGILSVGVVFGLITAEPKLFTSLWTFIRHGKTSTFGSSGSTTGAVVSQDISKDDF